MPEATVWRGADRGFQVGVSSHGDMTTRVAGQSDIAAIADLYGRLSLDCFAKRFMFLMNGSLVPLAQFSPGRGDVVLVAALAADPATPIAEARYTPTGDGVAEFAVVVEDRAQGHGIGRVLLAELVRVAGERGLLRPSAMVLADNVHMLRLVDRMGWVLVDTHEDDTVELEVSACGGMPGWPDEGRRRILVESRSMHEGEEGAALRAGGAVVRRCLGHWPGGSNVDFAGCPLVASGTCRLAEEADEIMDLLPEGVAAYDAIFAEHRRRWPKRLCPSGVF